MSKMELIAKVELLNEYPSFKAGHLNVSELARVCDLSRTTVYKYLSLLEN